MRDGEHRNTKYQIRHSKYSSEIVWGSPFKVISYSFLIMRIPHRVPPEGEASGKRVNYSKMVMTSIPELADRNQRIDTPGESPIPTHMWAALVGLMGH